MIAETIGVKLRKLREEQQLPLRKVSEIMDMDVALLSKMERGERKLTKEIILKFADIYHYSSDELMILFLSDKILLEIQGEDLGEKALKVAGKRVKFLKSNLSK